MLVGLPNETELAADDTDDADQGIFKADYCALIRVIRVIRG
jgi:hypothetical protein